MWEPAEAGQARGLGGMQFIVASSSMLLSLGCAVASSGVPGPASRPDPEPLEVVEGTCVE